MSKERTSEKIHSELEKAQSAYDSALRNADAFSPQSLGLFLENCMQEIKRLQKELEDQ